MNIFIPPLHQYMRLKERHDFYLPETSAWRIKSWMDRSGRKIVTTMDEDGEEVIKLWIPEGTIFKIGMYSIKNNKKQDTIKIRFASIDGGPLKTKDSAVWRFPPSCLKGAEIEILDRG